MLKTIFSGGETGADLGGIKFALKHKINIDGWMPFEWMTEDGPKPEYAGYGLKEHPSLGTAAKSEANVRDSDGTLVFASDFDSPGTACVLQAVKKYSKPYFKFEYISFGSDRVVDQIAEAKKWLAVHNIKVLNVAGNRESVSPGISLWAQGILEQLNNDSF